MTARRRRAALILGLVAALALLLVGVAAPRIAAGGWLIAFATLASVVLGAVAWLLIHALTGGGWGRLARPAFVEAAALTPLLILFFLVVLLASGVLYPWRHAAAHIDPGVGALYLNLGAFAARSLVLMAGLAVFAALSRPAPPGRLLAGLGLAWYAIGMDLVAIDWLLSLDPHYTSSAFGAQIIVLQLVGALAWVILATPADGDAGWPDLAALLLATVLGETYLMLMTFIIDWYGDLPRQAAWYLERSSGGWIAVEVAGFLVGAAGPLIALLFARVRHSPTILKAVAVAALLGVFVETLWLVAPATGAWSALASVLAIVAAAGVTLGVADRVPRFERRLRHGV